MLLAGKASGGEGFCAGGLEGGEGFWLAVVGVSWVMKGYRRPLEWATLADGQACFVRVQDAPREY